MDRNFLGLLMPAIVTELGFKDSRTTGIMTVTPAVEGEFMCEIGTLEIKGAPGSPDEIFLAVVRDIDKITRCRVRFTFQRLSFGHFNRSGIYN